MIFNFLSLDTLMLSAKTGVFAGMTMSAISMMLAMLKLNPLDLPIYMGCMITNKNNGPVAFLSGVLGHMMMSGAFGVMYFFIIKYFELPQTILYGIILGIMHTIFSGMMLPIMDSMNQCTANNKVPVMGFMAKAHGVYGTLIFTLMHIIYAVAFVLFLK